MTKNKITNPYEGLTPEQVIITMRKLREGETRNHFHMGLLYNYVLDSKLLEGTKYKSAMDFICDNVKEVSRTALSLYSAIARVFTEPVCAQFGFTCLQLLLAYVKVAKLELNHEEPGGTSIQVPDEHGEVKPKLFSECSVEEMRKAVARLRTPNGSTPISAEDRAMFDQYLEAVTSRFDKGSPVRVQMRNPEGTTLIDFKGIPMAQVDKLTEALVDLHYPVREMPEEEGAPQAT